MFTKIFIFVCVVFLSLMPIFSQTPPLEPGVSQTLAKWRSANYSAIRYKLNITLEKGAPLMKGEIEIRVNLTEEGAKNDLILDWRTTQFQNDKDRPFADVISVNGAERTGAQASPLALSAKREHIVKYLNVANDNGRFRVRSEHSLQAGTLALQSNEHLLIPKKFLKTGENIIKIEFASPIKSSGAAVTRYVDKEDGAEYVYSLFVPSDASTAFPVFDQPDLKAVFQLNARVPKGWKVISNSAEEDYGSDITDENGKVIQHGFEFERTKTISPYVFAFAAGEFEEFRGNKANMDAYPPDLKQSLETRAVALSRVSTTNIYVRKSQAEKFKAHEKEVFRLNREGVKFLESWFDYKFPFPKYDLVLIPEFPFGGMEHAGATFLREDRIIFPTEPTKNDYITRANVIFHEAAHQWFGDTVTMKWFDDLWLKEGFAEFMAYKTLEKIMPEYNAWKVFYERNKQAAYLTDVTRGTTPIYQEIPNLASAKSAYGNIVYRKAPSFLRQAEFYLGEKEFQTAVRAFLKKHEFANATWQDLVNEFEVATRLKFGGTIPSPNSPYDVRKWADIWVKNAGLATFRSYPFSTDGDYKMLIYKDKSDGAFHLNYSQIASSRTDAEWIQRILFLKILENGQKHIFRSILDNSRAMKIDEAEKANSKNRPPLKRRDEKSEMPKTVFVFPNYQDYGYGIFLLDEKSRAYVLENIQNEKDDFLRSMMWGSLWDSVRFYELAPEEYVRLVIKVLSSDFSRQTVAEKSAKNNIRNSSEKPPEGGTQNFVETDESTIATLLNRVSTAMNYYIPEEEKTTGTTGGNATAKERVTDKYSDTLPRSRVSAFILSQEIENLLIEKMRNSPTLGQRITFYRAFVSNASTENARKILKDILSGKMKIKELDLKTKDKFDIVTKLITLGDADGLKLLAELEKQYTDDAAKRYAYAARAGIPTAENKLKYWKDFTENKELSESWIESAFAVWNTPRHSELTLPYLEKSLAELPVLKRNRKIFFVNGWLAAFIGGQKSESALKTVNKFLADNPNLDIDLQRKILENSDNLERAVKIRAKYGK